MWSVCALVVNRTIVQVECLCTGSEQDDSTSGVFVHW